MDWGIFRAEGLAKALTDAGHDVSERTVNRWKAGTSRPSKGQLEAIRRLIGINEKEAAPPLWAERLQASIEAVYERQSTVGQEMAGKVIEALASPAQHEWAERIAARLDAPPTQSSEASDDRPGTEAPGAGTPAGRVPE